MSVPLVSVIQRGWLVSDPRMMLDILLTNKAAVLAQLQQYQAIFTAVANMLESEDEIALRQWLGETQTYYRHYRHVKENGSP